MRTIDQSKYCSSTEDHKYHCCDGQYLKRERERERERGVTKIVLQKRFYQGVGIHLHMTTFLVLTSCSRLLIFPVASFLNVGYAYEHLH